jgi:peptide/nickel transport system permease protein
VSDVVVVAGSVPAGQPDSRRLLRTVARRPAAVAGIVGVAVIVGVTLLAPLVAPHDPAAQDLSNILAPPIWAGGDADHVLGTDALGRDVASRLIYGGRYSLLISTAAMLIGSVLGLATGLIAGFVGGRTDTAIMRLGDVQLAFPFILLAIAVLGVVPQRTPLHLIVVLGIPGWIVYARVVRSRVLAEREKDYVLAAKALGASGRRRLFRYVFPSVWQVVPVIALLDIGFLIILESTLSFLGLGLPPGDPSWGGILAEGRRNMVISPWLPVLPGLAIMATVLAINLAADGMAGALDPGTRRRGLRRALPPAAGAERAPSDVPDSAEAPLLRVHGLHVEFPTGDHVMHAVRGVSFDLPRGRTLGIVGESGSGKSVTALSIIGLLDPPGRITAGTIRLDAADLTRLPEARMAELRGRQVAMIFQNPAASLNPVLTIGYQMIESLRRHQQPSADPEAQAREALRAVGIGNPDQVLRSYPFQLSGGMNQRVMIAMAMSAHPELLIADEPTTALDVTTQAQVLEQLGELTRRYRTSLILITHDIALVAEYADLVLVMYAGEVCEFGPVSDVVDDPHHPYTRALLESVPRADLPAGAVLQAIAGELPDPARIAPGCPFAPRCPEVMDVCRHVDPDAFQVGVDHRAACHLCCSLGERSVQVSARCAHQSSVTDTVLR